MDTQDSSPSLDNELKNLSENLKPATEWLKDAEKKLRLRGRAPDLPITFSRELNRKLWGLHRGELLVVGARTSHGKSLIVINLALDMIKQGKKVYFLSLEMTPAAIMTRMFCIEHSIDNIELMRGIFNEQEGVRKKWNQFLESAKGRKLLISDMIGRNQSHIDYIIKHMADKPDVIIIDHLQEINSKNGDKLKAIEDYLNKLRELAVRNNFALVVCSQINRISQSENDRRPQLHHLKSAGAIEEKADMVILSHWEHHFNANAERNKLELNIAKNREGATGYIDVKFIPEYSRLEDYGTTNSPKLDAATRATGERREEDDLYRPIVQQRKAPPSGQPSGDNSEEPPIKPEDIEWEK